MRSIAMNIIGIGLVGLTAGLGQAQVDPAAQCEAAKLTAAGKYATCRLAAESKAVTRGETADFTRCDAVLSRSWQSAESRGGAACPTLGDEMAVSDEVSMCTDRITEALTGAGFPPTQAFPASGQTIQFVMNDDGAIEAGAPLNYTDNGDGTITDNNTGLMWEKKIQRNSIPNGANLNDADNRYPWQGSCSVTTATACGTDADCPMGQTCDVGDGQVATPNGRTIFEWVAALNAANFAGHNDWRIPHVKELQSIVDYSKGNPAVDVAFNGVSCGAACTDLTDPACSCTLGGYWSATTYASTPASAWGVGYFDGFVGAFAKSNSLLAVRAVRGGSQ